TREVLDMPIESPVDDYVLFDGGGIRFEWTSRPASTRIPIHVAGVGDVDGDGVDDFALSDEQGTISESHRGVTYLIHGRDSFPPVVTLPYNLAGAVELDRVVRLGAEDVNQTGRCVAPVGDYNGDGYPAFLSGAQGDASTAFFMPGRMHVVFGGPDLPPVLDLADLGRHGFRLEGMRRSTFMNVASSSSGDLNGDGADDFAFAEGWFFDSAGSVHVLFGLGAQDALFIRGDANFDGRVDISDAIFALAYLFLGGEAPACEDAADADDQGAIDITDAIYILSHLFSEAPAPPPPYPLQGTDPTGGDPLGCKGF